MSGPTATGPIPTVTVVRRRVLGSAWVPGMVFRESARRRAEARGVAGHARNLGDGRAELEFEGEETAVDEMIAQSRRGSARAEVTRVEVEELPPIGRRGFSSADIADRHLGLRRARRHRPAVLAGLGSLVALAAGRMTPGW